MNESNPPLRWQTPSATTFPDIDLSSTISNKSNGSHNHHTNGRDNHHSTTKRRAPLSFPATDTTITPPVQQQFQIPQQFQIVVKENGEPLPPPPPFSPPPPPGNLPLELSSSGVERESSVVSSSSSSSEELAAKESCVKAPPPVAFHPRPWEEINGSWRATDNDNDVMNGSERSDSPPHVTTSPTTPENDTNDNTPSPPTSSHPPLPPLSTLIQPGITNRNAIPLYPTRTALLVIDIQSHLSTPPSSSLDPRSEYLFHTALPPVLDNIKRLVTCFRHHRSQLNKSSGCEIIWTFLQSLTNDNRDISLDYKLSGPLLSHLPTPQYPATFLPNLSPQKNDILLPKTSCSVFSSTIISHLLRNLGVEQLVICGQITNQCVESAVRDAADEGFFVTVVEDACAAYSKEEQEGGVRNMKGFARVKGTEEVMREMEQKREVKVGERVEAITTEVRDDPPVVSPSTITTVLHALSLTGVKRLRIISISSSPPPQPSFSAVTIPLSPSETSKYDAIDLSSLRLSSHCKTMATVFSLSHGDGRRLLQRRSADGVLRRVRAVVTLTLSRGGDKGEFWDRLGDECRWQMISVDEMKEETEGEEMGMTVVLSVDGETDGDGGLLRLADDIVRIKEIMVECAERCDGLSSASSVPFNPIQLSFQHHDINHFAYQTASSQQREQRIKHCLSLQSDVISPVNPSPDASDDKDGNARVSSEAVELKNDGDNTVVSIVPTVGPHFAMATLLDVLNRYDDADGGDDNSNVAVSADE